MGSWLKKYGMTILKDVGIALGFLPQITQVLNASNNQTVTKVSDTLTGIAGIIQTVESAFASAFGSTAQTGAAKLQAVQPEVGKLIQQWLAADFPGTAKIGDQTLFAKGVTEISQGVVDILNSIQTNPVTSMPVPASNPPAPAPTPQPVPEIAKTAS